MPKLVVIRGNSGSGKSTVAREVRSRYGRGCALIEQDYLRRILLREHDSPGGLAPALIEATTRAALDGGYHVVLEGILHSVRYGPMLRNLLTDYDGHAYYLSVTWAETLRRHSRRPQAAEFTPAQMREWYSADDLLATPSERLIPEASTLDRSATHILQTSGLATAPATSPCPTTCPRCRTNPPTP